MTLEKVDLFKLNSSAGTGSGLNPSTDSELTSSPKETLVPVGQGATELSAEIGSVSETYKSAINSSSIASAALFDDSKTGGTSEIKFDLESDLSKIAKKNESSPSVFGENIGSKSKVDTVDSIGLFTDKGDTVDAVLKCGAGSAEFDISELCKKDDLDDFKFVGVDLKRRKFARKFWAEAAEAVAKLKDGKKLSKEDQHYLTIVHLLKKHGYLTKEQAHSADARRFKRNFLGAVKSLLPNESSKATENKSNNSTVVSEEIQQTPKTGSSQVLSVDDKKTTIEQDKKVENNKLKLSPSQSLELLRKIKELKKQQEIYQACYAENLANCEETKAGKEESLTYSAECVEKTAEIMQDVFEEVDIDEYCDEDTLEEIYEIPTSFATTVTDNIIERAVANNCSPQTIQKLKDIKAQVIEKIEIRKQEIIQKHIAYLERKIEVKERILVRRKEVLVKRQEEQKVAKTNVAKAIATAKYWQSFAKKAIAWMGLNDLNIEAKREVIKKKDPKLAIEIAYAQKYKKWAIEEEATANFKARLAERAVTSMELSLGYTEALYDIASAQC